MANSPGLADQIISLHSLHINLAGMKPFRHGSYGSLFEAVPIKSPEKEMGPKPLVLSTDWYAAEENR